MPDDADATAARVYSELLERLGEGRPQPRLEPTRRVAELLGDVHRAFPVIQIAGTNGKTTTARMIESILRGLGLRTGLFTSPHLVSFTERIQIDGEPIGDQALAEAWTDVGPIVDIVDAELVARGDVRLTFFEVITALAFAAFAEAPVDVAVIEVGMGGEWDSTNVADAAVSVFTPIALDHMDRLGNTVIEIAKTKSGIIKPANLVVSAPQEESVLAVLRDAAERNESILNVLGSGGTSVVTEVAVGGQVVSIIGLAGIYDDLFLRLFGDHQSINAAVAVLAVESFLGGGSQELDTEVLAEAFAKVTSPGRLQVVASDPVVLVDAAHNPHGAQSLVEALGSYFDFGDVTLVVASLADKDYRGVLDVLTPFATTVIATTAPSERSLPAKDLAAAVPDGPRVVVIDDPVRALSEARSLAHGSERGAVVVTGSVTLVGLAIEQAAREGWA